MKRILLPIAAAALAFATGARSADTANAFWLVELEPGAVPHVHVVKAFDSAGTCFGAAVNRKPGPGKTAVCVPLDEASEAALIEYGAHEYGLIEGDF